MTIRCAVVGLGYWGPNLARNISACKGLELAALCDRDEARLEEIGAGFPAARRTAALDDVIGDPTIEAVFIAVPLAHHFAIAAAALRAGKHVFVEKPLAQTSAEAAELVALAERQQRVLMVDHIFVYTGAVQMMAKLVQGGAIGRPLYYDSVRVNLGLFQSDCNVLWDLAVHDVAIFDHVFGEAPVHLSAFGVKHGGTNQESIAHLTAFFPSGMIAHIHVSWLAPVKIRKVLVGGDAKMIVYDEVEPDEKLKIYDRGLTMTGSPENALAMKVDYRMGDVSVPKLDRTEALRTAIAHFRDCVREGRTPITDGRAGLRAVRVLEAADRAILNQSSNVVPVSS